MSTLIGIIFEKDQKGAIGALSQLRLAPREFAIELEDAVIAIRNDNGLVELDQSRDLSTELAFSGGVVGSLIGVLFAGPVGWLVVGAASAGLGALMGAVTDFGIDDDFIKQLSSNMSPRSSALFVLTRTMVDNEFFDQFKGLGGKLITTSLSEDAEHRLQSALKG